MTFEPYVRANGHRRARAATKALAASATVGSLGIAGLLAFHAPGAADNGSSSTATAHSRDSDSDDSDSRPQVGRLQGLGTPNRSGTVTGRLGAGGVVGASGHTHTQSSGS
jgi:hypothetical protein